MRYAILALILFLAACREPSVDTSSNETAVPAPQSDAVGEGSEMAYTERDVEPRLLNGPEVRGMLDSLYPETLKEEGIGGRVLLWILVDESGNVTETKLQTSSGYPALDRAAEEVADSMRFTPAQNKGNPVSVWIAQPIDFRADE